MGIAQQTGTERHAVTTPVIGEELALEARDVDPYGALGLAGATLETEVECFVYALIAEARLAKPTRHRQAQHIGAPACRVLLVAGRHVRGAHRALERLAAD